MWRHYRCKRCGRVIYIDPGEKTLCEDCMEAEEDKEAPDIQEGSGHGSRKEEEVTEHDV